MPIISIITLPNPPLRYWPCPPTIDATILDQSLSFHHSKTNDTASLVHHLSLLTELQQQVNRHYHEVVEWTERCHAESVVIPRPGRGGSVDWLEFVQQIKLYLNDRVSRRSKEIEESIQATLAHMTTLRQDLVDRLEQLEGQF
mmetsp:Transcript_5479/g.9031  ORF Transcript_5479/g.9031 Transcript_5479/m.9031 type:complete len:143 (-) Transcript_5479:124-552(-)